MFSKINSIVKEFERSVNSSKKSDSNEHLKQLCEVQVEILIIPAPNSEPKKNCGICNFDFFVKDLITVDCLHRFCKPDLQKLVSSIIECPDFSSDKLICPICSKKLDPEPLNELHVVKSLVSQELFDKYDQYLLNQIVEIEKPPKPQPQKPALLKCLTCCDDYINSEIITLACSHPFCKFCLRKQFFAIIDNLDKLKDVSMELFKCSQCLSPILINIINGVLPEKDRDKLDKAFKRKTKQLLLPEIFQNDQIKDFELYIEKLKSKKKNYDVFQIEGALKEKSQIAITFYDDRIYKKLKKKIKYFNEYNKQKPKDDFPQEWGIFPENVRIVVLAKEDPKYQFVMNEFMKTCQNNQIMSISEIQNKELYKEYKKTTSKVIAKKKALNPNLDTSQFEKYLWHGTRANNPESIYMDDEVGFDVRHANIGGSKGAGTYFAFSASYSLGYGYKNPNTGNTVMLFNKVFVGETLQGGGQYHHAPPIPNTNNRFYDSTSDQSMVVVYDPHRAYPHYIVEFK